MTEPTTTGHRRYTNRSDAVARAGLVAAASLLLGGVTFFAQGFLPDAVTSFANSASGWTLLTVLLIYAARLNTPASAVLGAVSFVLLVVGYALVAQLQGLFYSPVMFGLVGGVAGPFVGAAAAWLRSESQSKAAAGTALLAGIGIGEGLYGLTYIGDTTSPVYWTVIAVAGVALLAAMAVRRLRSGRSIAIAVAGAAVTASAFVAAYIALGSVASM